MIIGDGILLGTSGATASIFVAGLSKTDSVSVTKDGKSFVGKWVTAQNPASHGLPNGYTEIEFIRNTGNANVSLLNTGIYWGNISRIEYIINVISPPPNGAMIFSGGSGKLPWLCTSGQNNGINGLSHNFVNNGISSSSFSSVSTNNPFCISGWSDDAWTGTYQYKIIRLFNASNNLIFEGIPCKQNSNSAIGLYDIVSKAFKSGYGFIAGTEIPKNTEGREFTVNKYGTYTITASNGTNTITKEVLVDLADVFSVEVTL